VARSEPEATTKAIESLNKPPIAARPGLIIIRVASRRTRSRMIIDTLGLSIVARPDLPIIRVFSLQQDWASPLVQDAVETLMITKSRDSARGEGVRGLGEPRGGA
jgi:hypothetical protein